ncbi:MAG: type secretion system protein PorQ [Bacteroidota bacterium]|jgi:hypothetical protein
MKFKKYFILFIFSCAVLSSYAQTGANTTFEFLRMPVSAKAIALGGYAIAPQNNDISLAAFTPSLLNENLNRNFALNHAILFGGIQHGQVSYARFSKKNDITFAGNIQYINYGNFTRTDDAGATHGHFGAEETAIQFGFGKKLNPLFSYGANAKLIVSRFDNLLATGIATDISATYNDTAKKIALTFLIKNAGLQLKNYQYNNYTDNFGNEIFPTDALIGFSKRLAHIPFALHVTAHHLTKWNIRYFNAADNISASIINADTSNSTKTKKYIADKIFRHLNFAGEFFLGKSLSVQIGYNNLRRQELKTTSRNGLIGFSGGFQIKTKKFTVGYARAWYYLPSASNTLSLSFII